MESSARERENELGILAGASVKINKQQGFFFARLRTLEASISFFIYTPGDCALGRREKPPPHGRTTTIYTDSRSARSRGQKRLSAGPLRDSLLRSLVRSLSPAIRECTVLFISPLSFRPPRAAARKPLILPGQVVVATVFDPLTVRLFLRMRKHGFEQGKPCVLART